jgi:hypothetical protein
MARNGDDGYAPYASWVKDKGKPETGKNKKLNLF